MDDHFWPAVYPGIAIGLLYGLHRGGTANVILAAMGGFASSYLAFSTLPGFFGADGLMPLAAMLGSSLAGAIAASFAGRTFSARYIARSGSSG